MQPTSAFAAIAARGSSRVGKNRSSAWIICLTVGSLAVLAYIQTSQVLPSGSSIGQPLAVQGEDGRGSTDIRMDVESLGASLEACLVAMRPLPSASGVGGEGADLSMVGAAESDDEWRNLPRHTIGVVGKFRCASPSLEPKVMFRCQELNPADTYIPKSRREELEAIFSHVAPRLSQVRTAALSVYSRDFDGARSRGTLRDLGIPLRQVTAGNSHPAGEGTKLSDISIDAMTNAGADMGVIVGERVLGASRADFPASRQALDMTRFLGTELAFGVVAWFSSVGAIDQPRADALMAAVLR